MQPDEGIRRVLIHRLGSLGDTVVALPCFHLIARAFPNAERRLLTNFPVHAKAPASAAVLGDSGLVHGYLRYTVGTRNPVELLRLAGEIRRFRPEVLVYLMPLRPWKAVRRDLLFFRFAGVGRVAGNVGEKEMQSRFDASTGLFERESDRLARMVAGLGDAGTADAANWDFLLTDGERERALVALGALAGRPLVVCGPGTKRWVNDWGVEKWQSLLGRIGAKYPGHGLALVGAKEDFDGAKRVAMHWTGPSLNLCGRLAPRETAAAMEKARIFLGPDSGPMHLAAAVGVPCAIPFSARGLPGIWFPRGSRHQILYHRPGCFGCGLERCNVAGQPCLTSISVEEMEAAVDRVMEGKEGRQELVLLPS